MNITLYKKSRALKALLLFLPLAFSFQPSAALSEPLAISQLPLASQPSPSLTGRDGVGLLINEVMQSNIDNLMVDNDFPDSWLELYNPTPSAINLRGWRIGVKDDFALCYALPAQTIAAGGHIVICCDKTTVPDASTSGSIHTDFRIDSGKGGIYLFNPQGELVESLSLKKMPAPNVAYGRTSDGADDWYYEYKPTPGSANGGGGSMTVLPQPIFSIQGGVYPEALEDMVYISMPEGVPDDALIFYTFNGTEPGMTGRGKLLYFPIKQTTIIRAKILSASGNGVPSPTVTHSYIIHPREVTMPVVSLCTDSKYLNDPQIGILSATVNDGVPNYMQKWRRPLNVEYFDINGVQRINQIGETAVSGVSTRENIQKSLKLYANKRFGTKTFSLSEPSASPSEPLAITQQPLASQPELRTLWKDKPNVTAVKSMVLRSGGNNSASSKINDALVQTLFGTHVDNLDWQAYQPVIVYLNGQYYGEYALRERSDEDYVESNYDGLEDIELADHNSYQSPEPGSQFADFHNLYHNKSATYADITAQMDEDNFLKTLCAEIYGMNTDYPTNNVSMWKPLANSQQPTASEQGSEPKWRWILKDMDRFGMSLPLYPRSFDMIRYLFSPDDLMYGGMKHFDLYARMGKFSQFTDKFIDMMAVYLGDFLKPSVVNEKIGQMRSEIEPEVKATFSKYHISMNDFTSGMNYLTRTANERPGYLYDQLNSYFKLGGVYPVSVLVEPENPESPETLTTLKPQNLITLNGIPLTEGNFDGKYFGNRTLTLEAPEGCTWQMTVTKAGVPTVTTYETAAISVPFPTLGLSTGATISFQLIPGKEEPTGITAPEALTTSKPQNLTFNLAGQKVGAGYRGIVIKNGKKVVVK